MKKLIEILAALGGAVASFFTELPPVMWVLIAVMFIDYITGLICGWMGVSPKTESGGLSSQAAFRGLLKKALIILIVLLAALMDKAVAMGAGVEFNATTGAACLWFIASEGISILENAAAMGVPVPGIIKNALEIFRQQGDGGKPPDGGGVGGDLTR